MKKRHDLEHAEPHVSPEAGTTFRSVVLPFMIVTAIWGSTWIVIRGQFGPVPPQWSVTYRFAIAALAMAFIAAWKRESLRLGARALLPAAFLGFMQFCVNYNAVYLAERHITSGVVATVFALLLIPASLLGWAWLGHRPSSRFAWSSLVAISGVVLLFVHEIREHPTDRSEIAVGIGITLVGVVGAALANVVQARPEIRRFPLFALLSWSMAAGALFNALIALATTGEPVFDPRPSYWLGLLYLSLAASVLTFSLYYQIIRRIGPGKTAYSSVIVPVIAMGFSTWFEDYRWTTLAIAGAILALGGMAAALGLDRAKIPAPDAA